jgi:hypothetical protein
VCGTKFMGQVYDAEWVRVDEPQEDGRKKVGEGRWARWVQVGDVKRE